MKYQIFPSKAVRASFDFLMPWFRIDSVGLRMVERWVLGEISDSAIYMTAKGGLFPKLSSCDAQ